MSSFYEYNIPIPRPVCSHGYKYVRVNAYIQSSVVFEDPMQL